MPDWLFNLLAVIFGTGIGALIVSIFGARVRAVNERRAEDRQARAWDRGIDAIPGVTDGVPRGPVRVETLEEQMVVVRGDIKILQGSVSNLGAGQAVMSEVLEQVKDAVASVDEKVRKVLPNGGDTNDTGDLVARLAQHAGVYRDDPNGATLKRRKDDE